MEKYEVGKIIEGKVTGITKYGIFLKLENDYTGLIHISELANKFIYDISTTFVIGEFVKARILFVNNDEKQVKLSTKNLEKENYKILKESKNGFAPLRNNLDFWVKNRLESLKK